MLSLSQKKDSNITLSSTPINSSDKLVSKMYSKFPIKNTEYLTDVTNQISNKDEILLKLVSYNSQLPAVAAQTADEMWLWMPRNIYV